MLNDWYEAEKCKVDGIILLQPTSPFRKKEALCEGIDLYIKNFPNPVLGVSPTHTHPMWTFKKEGDYIVPFMQEQGMQTRSQDLPPTYVVNGSFYLISPSKLRENRSFFGKKTIPLLIESPQESLDIDTEWDYKMAVLISNNSQST